MACGTGKTFASLLTAEKQVGCGGRVLYFVPSLALANQTIIHWNRDASVPLRNIVVCSDQTVGKRRQDDADIGLENLLVPATTSAEKLAESLREDDPDRMTVVYCTYQSSDVIREAQFEHDAGYFDLTICDEAHRTAGTHGEKEDPSQFVAVNRNDRIKTRKRLYMTATPIVYRDNKKDDTVEVGAALYSMDDEGIYGKVVAQRSFDWAVEQGYLSDFKVIVLALDEDEIAADLQELFQRDDGGGIATEDAVKYLGCYYALSRKNRDGTALNGPNPNPMRSALVFCNKIASSKSFMSGFPEVIKAFRAGSIAEGSDIGGLECDVHHVDGMMPTKLREGELQWLRRAGREGECRILSNAKCLGEGVDVPALDGILFLHPKKSQVEVVQAVGRVMRKYAGKEYGYVILPVVIPRNQDPGKLFSANGPYKVVWQVCNALRSHNQRLSDDFARAGLGEDIRDRIEIVAVRGGLRAETYNPSGDGLVNVGQGSNADLPDGDVVEEYPIPESDEENKQYNLPWELLPRAIMAEIVKKCGTRDYYESWGEEIGRITQTHIDRITRDIENDEIRRQMFEEFVGIFQKHLSPNVTESDAIEMLAQHMVSRPIFETLFPRRAEVEWVQGDPVRQALDTMVEILKPDRYDPEVETLEEFYKGVRKRVGRLRKSSSKQQIIKKLYENFFAGAFPTTAAKMGIAFTPVELVDFVVRSVEDVLQEHFGGKSLANPEVHILEPFAGTGTFPARMLEIIEMTEEERAYKYQKELHANEIVLLSHYIASANIETVYESLQGYHEPFQNLCLMDSLNSTNLQRDIPVDVLKGAAARAKHQRELPIRVIMTNPPWGQGQKKSGDGRKQAKTSDVEDRIRDTYAKEVNATLLKSLYNQAYKGLRWATDRLRDEDGVIGMILPHGWLYGHTTTGIRRIVSKEFSHIYIVDLLGDAKTRGDERRRQGDEVFQQHSREGVCLCIFVRNQAQDNIGDINYHCIGEYLKLEEKFKRIRKFDSISGITSRDKWTKLTFDRHGNWFGHETEEVYDTLIPMAGKGNNGQRNAYWKQYGLGVTTAREARVYNSNRAKLETRIEETIHYYNQDLINGYKSSNGDIVRYTSTLNRHYEKGDTLQFEQGEIVQAMYRLFDKRWLYYGGPLTDRIGHMRFCFPLKHDVSNRLIIVSGTGSSVPFSCLMADCVVDHAVIGEGQCCPLYIYEKIENSKDKKYDLFNSQDGRALKRKSGVDEKMQGKLLGPGDWAEDDWFYYVYGVLHNNGYRQRFKNELMRRIPRLPHGESLEIVKAHVEAGRQLAELHLNYDGQPAPPEVRVVESEPNSSRRVGKTEMQWGRDPENRRRSTDRNVIQYNDKIKLENIPSEVYNWEVSGYPAVKWVMRQWRINHEASNDPNDWAREVMNDENYPLKLLLSVMTVGRETDRIVRQLPELVIQPEN